MLDPRNADALRLLGRLWVEELRPEDLASLGRLPELADALGGAGSADLTDLAAEHQRLFGFNLPPYESLYLDPSGLLGAPATQRVAQRLQAAGWTAPAGWRAAAPDHLGLLLRATGELLAAGDAASAGAAQALLTEHLALWAPLCIAGLRRLAPHPFYQALGALTLGVLLNALPEEGLRADLPELPEAPHYQGSDAAIPGSEPPPAGPPPSEPAPSPLPPWAVPLSAAPAEAPSRDLDGLVQDLLLPRASGLYLTRRDIAGLAHGLGLTAPAGERRRMLASLLRGAGGLGLADPVLRHLDALLAEEAANLGAWAEAWPAWAPVARLWTARLAARRAELAEGLAQT